MACETIHRLCPDTWPGQRSKAPRKARWLGQVRTGHAAQEPQRGTCADWQSAGAAAGSSAIEKRAHRGRPPRELAAAESTPHTTGHAATAAHAGPSAHLPPPGAEQQLLGAAGVAARSEAVGRPLVRRVEYQALLAGRESGLLRQALLCLPHARLWVFNERLRAQLHSAAAAPQPAQRRSDPWRAHRAAHLTLAAWGGAGHVHPRLRRSATIKRATPDRSSPHGEVLERLHLLALSEPYRGQELAGPEEQATEPEGVSRALCDGGAAMERRHASLADRLADRRGVQELQLLVGRSRRSVGPVVLLLGAAARCPRRSPATWT